MEAVNTTNCLSDSVCQFPSLFKFMSSNNKSGLTQQICQPLTSINNVNWVGIRLSSQRPHPVKIKNETFHTYAQNSCSLKCVRGKQGLSDAGGAIRWMWGEGRYQHTARWKRGMSFHLYYYRQVECHGNWSDSLCGIKRGIESNSA